MNIGSGPHSMTRISGRKGIITTLLVLFAVACSWLLYREAKWNKSAAAIRAVGGDVRPLSFEDRITSLRVRLTRKRTTKRSPPNGYESPIPAGASVNFGKSAKTPSSVFKALGELPGLWSLNMREMEFAPEDLAPLEQATNLSVLFLFRTSTNDESLTYFRNLEDLNFLVLTETQVTDRGIAELVHLPRLSFLSASDLPLTDASVDHLCQIRSLREIEIFNTQISDEGVKRLRRELPNCKINR